MAKAGGGIQQKVEILLNLIQKSSGTAVKKETIEIAKDMKRLGVNLVEVKGEYKDSSRAASVALKKMKDGTEKVVIATKKRMATDKSITRGKKIEIVVNEKEIAQKKRLEQAEKKLERVKKKREAQDKKTRSMADQLHRRSLLAANDVKKLTKVLNYHNKTLKKETDLTKVSTKVLSARAGIQKKIENLQRRSTQSMHRNRLEVDRISNSLRRFGMVGIIAYAGLIRQSVTFAIELTRLKAVTGAEVKEIAKLSAVAAGFGIDAQVFIKSVGGLSQALLTAGEGTSLVAKRVREVLREAGLEAERFKGKHMPVLKVLEMAKKAYQALPSPIDKAYLAQRYFGENAESMMPFLEASDDAIKGLIDTIGTLPGLTERSTQRMMDFNVKLQTLALIGKSAGFVIAESLIPLIEKVGTFAKQASFFIKGMEDRIGIFSQAGIIFSGVTLALGFLIPTVVAAQRAFTLMGVHVTGALKSFKTLSVFLKGTAAWFLSPVGAIITALALAAVGLVYFKLQTTKARGEMKVAAEDAETLAEKIRLIRVTAENRQVIEYLELLNETLKRLRAGEDDTAWRTWKWGITKEDMAEFDTAMGKIKDKMRDAGEDMSSTFDQIWAAARKVPTKEMNKLLAEMRKEIIGMEKERRSLTAEEILQLNMMYANYQKYLKMIYRGDVAKAKWMTFVVEVSGKIKEALLDEEIAAKKVVDTYDEWINKEEKLAQETNMSLDEQYERRKKQLDIIKQIFVQEGELGQAIKAGNFAIADRAKSFIAILENEREVKMAKDEVVKAEKWLKKTANDRLKILERVKKQTEEIAKSAYDSHPAYKGIITLLTKQEKILKDIQKAGNVGDKAEKLRNAVKKKMLVLIGKIAVKEDEKVLRRKISLLEQETSLTFAQMEELRSLREAEAQRQIEEIKFVRDETLKALKARGATDKELAAAKILLEKSVAGEIIDINKKLRGDLKKIWEEDKEDAKERIVDTVNFFKDADSEYNKSIEGRKRLFRKASEDENKIYTETIEDIMRRREQELKGIDKDSLEEFRIKKKYDEEIEKARQTFFENLRIIAEETGLKGRRAAKSIVDAFTTAKTQILNMLFALRKELEKEFDVRFRVRTVAEKAGEPIESKAKGGYLTPAGDWKPLNLVPKLDKGGMIVQVHPNEVISPLSELPKVAQRMGLTENKTLNMNVSTSLDVQELYRQIKRFMAIDNYQERGLGGIS